MLVGMGREAGATGPCRRWFVRQGTSPDTNAPVWRAEEPLPRPALLVKRSRVTRFVATSRFGWIELIVGTGRSQDRAVCPIGTDIGVRSLDGCG